MEVLFTTLGFIVMGFLILGTLALILLCVVVGTCILLSYVYTTFKYRKPKAEKATLLSEAPLKQQAYIIAACGVNQIAGVSNKCGFDRIWRGLPGGAVTEGEEPQDAALRAAKAAGWDIKGQLTHVRSAFVGEVLTHWYKASELATNHEDGPYATTMLRLTPAEVAELGYGTDSPALRRVVDLVCQSSIWAERLTQLKYGVHIPEGEGNVQHDLVRAIKKDVT